MDFEERLRSWRDALKWKHLLWFLLLLPGHLVRELLEDRFVGGLNGYIDKHSDTILSQLANIARFFLTHPVSSAAIFAILIFVALLVHAYVETRPNTVQNPIDYVVAEPSRFGQTKTYEIRFDYLPGNMLDNGWSRAYPKNATVKPTATIASDPPIAGSVDIDAPADHAYDHPLPVSAKLSNRLVFAAKYTASTMIFTHVELSSADGTQRVRKLIKYVVGDSPPHPTKGWEEGEYTFPIIGEPLKNQWRKFDIALPDVVARTWGKNGLIFRGVTVFSLRGSLGISPIEFYESRSAAS
jgi:hypothetical protein